MRKVTYNLGQTKRRISKSLWDGGNNILLLKKILIKVFSTKNFNNHILIKHKLTTKFEECLRHNVLIQ